MQNISCRYTTWINRRMNRTGHLFQGRYRAILVDTDSYLLELVAYLHLNPVRSGTVIREIVAVVTSISGIAEKALNSRQRLRESTEARTLIAWAVSEFSGATISEVARMYGRDVSTLSACIKRMTGKAHTDANVAETMKAVRVALENKTTKQAQFCPLFTNLLGGVEVVYKSIQKH